MLTRNAVCGVEAVRVGVQCGTRKPPRSALGGQGHEPLRASGKPARRSRHSAVSTHSAARGCPIYRVSCHLDLHLGLPALPCGCPFSQPLSPLCVTLSQASATECECLDPTHHAARHYRAPQPVAPPRPTHTCTDPTAMPTTHPRPGPSVSVPLPYFPYAYTPPGRLPPAIISAHGRSRTPTGKTGRRLMQSRRLKLNQPTRPRPLRDRRVFRRTALHGGMAARLEEARGPGLRRELRTAAPLMQTPQQPRRRICRRRTPSLSRRRPTGALHPGAVHQTQYEPGPGVAVARCVILTDAKRSAVPNPHEGIDEYLLRGCLPVDGASV